MAMTIDTLEKLLKEGIPHATVRIEDLRGDGEHYAAYIASTAFAGMSRVQQHQMVFAALKGKMGANGDESLHALSIHTSLPTPESTGA